MVNDSDGHGLRQPSRQQLSIALAMMIIATPLVACDNDRGDAPAMDTDAPAQDAVDCEALQSRIDMTLCLVDIATDAGTTAACDVTGDPGVRFQCYAIFAERLGDPETCRRIPDQGEDFRDLRDACLADVAPVAERPELCEEVRESGLRDGCFLSVYRVTADATLCDRIEDAGLRSLCTGVPTDAMNPD